MPRNQIYTEPVECWNMLAYALSVGHTIPFTYYPDKEQRFVLTHGFGTGYGYHDESCQQYLMDDIQFALFEEKRPYIDLLLSDTRDGPITEHWRFTFTKEGLSQAEYYYNDD